MTAFEDQYLARINRVALWFFYWHLPVFALISWVNDTGPAFTMFLTAVTLAGPTIAVRTLKSRRNVSLVHAFTAMCMGGILVHIGQGPVHDRRQRVLQIPLPQRPAQGFGEHHAVIRLVFGRDRGVGHVGHDCGYGAGARARPDQGAMHAHAMGEAGSERGGEAAAGGAMPGRLRPGGASAGG